MYKTVNLLVVSVLGVALLAPTARSEDKQLTQIQLDLIDLTSRIKALQESADKKNAEMAGVLSQIIVRFNTVDANFRKLDTALAAIKTGSEKSAADLEQTRLAVNTLRQNLDKLDLAQTFLDIKNGLGGIKTQLRDLQNAESSLPTARQAYDSAFGLLSQNFPEDAISEFQDFLKTYPKDSKASRAQLNIGTAYFDQKKFSQALVAYDLAIQNYPESDTKCTALFKKGKTLVELKQATEARPVFQSVVKECPGTDESNLAAVELKKLPAAPAESKKPPTAPAPARGARGQ